MCALIRNAVVGGNRPLASCGAASLESASMMVGPAYFLECTTDRKNDQDAYLRPTLRQLRSPISALSGRGPDWTVIRRAQRNLPRPVVDGVVKGLAGLDGGRFRGVDVDALARARGCRLWRAARDLIEKVRKPAILSVWPLARAQSRVGNIADTASSTPALDWEVSVAIADGQFGLAHLPSPVVSAHLSISRHR